MSFGDAPFGTSPFGESAADGGLSGDPNTTIATDREAPNLAVDIQPDYSTGTFTFDVSEWDGPDMLAWGDGVDGWVNVVCDVTSVQTRRGLTRAGGALTIAEDGSCRVELTDTDRRFDPTNNAEAIHPGTPLRIRAWGAGWSEVLFTGRIGAGAEGIQVAYSKYGPPKVTILAVDRITPLAAWAAIGRPEPGVGGGDDLRERVLRVLAEMSWPTTVMSTDIDTAFTATLANNVLAKSWDHLEDCTEAELGRLWVDRQDRLVVRARGSELSGPVRGTLSDFHDEIVGGTVHCCYDDAQVVYGTELLTNRAIGGRRIPRVEDAPDVPVTLAQVDDEYSQGRYGLVALERRSLELETDDQLLPWCQTAVLGATEPELRVNSVSVAPRNAPEAWPQVAATDIGDRWSFRLRPELGPVVARTVGVLGVVHDITPEEWLCTWITETAPTPGDNNPSGWFTFDVSEWDGDDLLAPVGGK